MRGNPVHVRLFVYYVGRAKLAVGGVFAYAKAASKAPSQNRRAIAPLQFVAAACKVDIKPLGPAVSALVPARFPSFSLLREIWTIDLPEEYDESGYYVRGEDLPEQNGEFEYDICDVEDC